MLEIEARVQIVEERMSDYQQSVRELSEQLGRFESRTDARVTAFEARVDTRFAALEEKVDTGFALVGQEMVALRRDMTAQMSTQLRWTAGMMLTGLIAIVTAIVAALVTR